MDAFFKFGGGCLDQEDKSKLSAALVAGVLGQALSTYSSKSRSVPGWAYSKTSVLICGIATGAAGNFPDSIGFSATAALALLGRWDNARAETVPRWEEHGAGATGVVSRIWALSLTWCCGWIWSRAWLKLWTSERREVQSLAILSAVAIAGLSLGTPSVAWPGGPRPRPIGRKPKWKPGKRPKPSPRWRFAAGEASHLLSLKTPDVQLTGEAAGRQIWYYAEEEEKYQEDHTLSNTIESFDPSINPNTSDRLFRAVQLQSNTQKTDIKEETKSNNHVLKALKRGLAFYQRLQCDDGHFAGDYGGPHFLSPGLVVAWYVLDKPDNLLNAPQREAMALYYKNHQQADGGWGTHIESPSTMFGSVLVYTALRLLLADDFDPENNPAAAAALEFIRKNKGALYTSSWAKFALCLLGVMDWQGHESVPPEMWLLPEWTPFHPCRMWCHARMVYLPMSYLWGKRWVYPKAETDELVLRLRQELYIESYETIPWIKTRSLVAPFDDYSPVHPVMKLGQLVLRYYESSRLLAPLRRRLRTRGVRFAARYVYAEDQQTNYIDIGPVNKVYNLLVAADDSERPDAPHALDRHCLRVPDYLWVAEDGMKMQGYNGSQCWDTSFFAQALVESRLGDEPAYRDCAKQAFEFLDKTQILSTVKAQTSPAFPYEQWQQRQRAFRHVSKGGWPFSTSAHGWPISDCTAEGLKSVLAMQLGLDCIKENSVSLERLTDAVNVILTLQNHDGGWATYENNRGYGWYEWLNPSEVFGDIMIDYSYVECSMASATALRSFLDAFPSHSRASEISIALGRGNAFLKSIQRYDGSWYGSWGCCFTYAVWFGIEGLVATGEDPESSRHVQNACTFLISKQRPDGGWGETFESCFDKRYSDGPSHVVNTAWALLGLMAGHCPDINAVDRGMDYLLHAQQSSGDWPQQGISGVFNRACGITYTAYRNVFPIWALARYHSFYRPIMILAKTTPSSP